MSLLKLENIHKSYQDHHVLQGVNLKIAAGEQLALVGPSGSGKSTLLHIIGALDHCDQGEVVFAGQNYAKMRRSQLAKLRNQKIGFIFQSHYLLPAMTCRENIYLPTRIRGKGLSEVKKRVSSLAERLGVAQLLDRYPQKISGGEQQRVNILRAISGRPQILLCDEPTGNLDVKNSQKVLELLFELSREEGIALLFVTHDQQMSKQFAKKISIIDGKVSAPSR